jgi:hypothetical protein
LKIPVNKKGGILSVWDSVLIIAFSLIQLEKFSLYEH